MLLERWLERERSIEIGQNSSTHVHVYTCEKGSESDDRSEFIFPIENLLETRVSRWYGQTMGAKTGRSSGGIRTYTYTRVYIYTR